MFLVEKYSLKFPVNIAALKAFFLVVLSSYYTVMIFLIMLFSILLSILIILPFTLSMIRLLISKANRVCFLT